MDVEGLVGCFQNDSACVFTCLNREVRKEIDYDRIATVAQLSTQLPHPNLLKYHGVVCNEQQSVVIMEKVEWDSLRSYLLGSPNRAISEEEVRPIFRQILNALEQLHVTAKVAHTKLNLSNVFYDIASHMVKVGDYVICDRTPPLVKQDVPGAAMHPYVFMAPEIWFNTGKVDDPKSDIWSLGVMLYTLVCGYYPFFGSNKNELFRGIIQGPAGYPQHLSPLCIDLLVSLMQFSPEERPSISAVKMHDWVNIGQNNNHHYISKASLLSSPPLSYQGSSSSSSSAAGALMTSQNQMMAAGNASYMSSGPVQSVTDQHVKQTKRKGSWQEEGNGDSPSQSRVKRRNSVATMQNGDARPASKMSPVMQGNAPRGSPRRSSPKDQKDLLLEQQYLRQQQLASSDDMMGSGSSGEFSSSSSSSSSSPAISMSALNGMNPASQMKILQLQQTLFGNQNKGDETDPELRADKQKWIQKIRSSPPQKASDFAERRRGPNGKIIEVSGNNSPPQDNNNNNSAPTTPPAPAVATASSSPSSATSSSTTPTTAPAATTSDSNIHKLPSHILNTLMSIQSASGLLAQAGAPSSSSSLSNSSEDNNNNHSAQQQQQQQRDLLPPPPAPAPRTGLGASSAFTSSSSNTNNNNSSSNSNSMPPPPGTFTKLFASASLTSMPSLSQLQNMPSLTSFPSLSSFSSLSSFPSFSSNPSGAHSLASSTPTSTSGASGLASMPSFTNLHGLSVTSSLSLSDIPSAFGISSSLHQPSFEPFSETPTNTISFDEFDKYIDKNYFDPNANPNATAAPAPSL